jgi:hypothetical protein
MNSTEVEEFGPRAGVACCDVTPVDSQFLFGYPHVQRMSDGVHDPLLASALYLHDGQTEVVFVAVDIAYLTKQHVAKVRSEISKKTGIPEPCIMVTATHTHSGPITVELLSNAGDYVVPKPDPSCVQLLLEGIATAGIEAKANAEPAEFAFLCPDVPGLGTNRHDPGGPSILEVPTLVVGARNEQRVLGLMCVCSMHPTVLHEDSQVVSGDFPGCARQNLQRHFGEQVVFVYHMGASGNQSPRYVVTANTMSEAERLGEIFSQQIIDSYEGVDHQGDWSLNCVSDAIELPLRTMASVADAESREDSARKHLEDLQLNLTDKAAVRTAECDWFGATESFALAQAQQDGRLQAVAESCMPAEIQIIGIGPWKFVGWQGEVFTEFALQVRETHPEAIVITLANGELQGYLVTEEAIRNNRYEALNAIFASPDSGEALVSRTKALLSEAQVAIETPSKP